MYANTTEITMRPAVTWKLYNAAPSSQKVVHAWPGQWVVDEVPTAWSRRPP